MFIQLIMLYTVLSMTSLIFIQPRYHGLHRRIIIPLPLRPSLLTPREVHHRKGKERIRRIRETSQHIVPRDESSDDAERASRYSQPVMWESIGSVAGIEVRDSETDKSDPDRKE
jgi:hypothetical protein